MSNEAKVNTDDHPDVVHILGAWNPKVFKKLKHYVALKIPVVYSPLSGITPWMIAAKRRKIGSLLQFYQQKQAVRKANSVVAFSRSEAKAMAKWRKKENLCELRNSIITHRYPSSTLAAELLAHYQQVIASHDRHIRLQIEDQVQKLKIEDENINILLQKILYLKYQQHRGYIPIPLLQDLTQNLIEREMDEDSFIQTIKDLKLLKFVSFLQNKMAQECGLTEGYMPVPLKE
ncbi:hypothetical protein C3V39_10985 [Prevotella sp. oral taxon 820]|nr:hypothetical protein C3V39_10985 [Prevotella sp. oral taxon 820]